MIVDPRECPNCKSHNTQQKVTEYTDQEITVVYICNDCPTQYYVEYGDPVIADSITHE